MAQYDSKITDAVLKTLSRVEHKINQVDVVVITSYGIESRSGYDVREEIRSIVSDEICRVLERDLER